MRITLFVFSGFFLLTGISCTYGQSAVAPRDCLAIENAIAATQKTEKIEKTAAIIPEALIADWQKALPCLVGAIEKLKPRVTADVFDDGVRATFMSVTAALRSIVARLSAQDKASNNQNLVRQFVSEFRAVDNLDVTWVLAYGVRNQSGDIRLNSLLILANVIDNNTLCVPLDHLYDPALGKTEYGRRGRANLLSVISVVAPWAYFENYKNIENAQKFVRGQDLNNELFKDTNAILANIDARLQSQTDSSNKTVRMKDEEAKDCKAYKLSWAKKEQLSY